MKFFKNNKALTLAELLVSITISAFLFGIVIYFTMTNVNELADNHVKTDTMQKVISIQDTISEFVISGYKTPIIINQIIDSSYEKTNPNPNDVLILENENTGEGIMIGIVNFNTRNIQKNYIYGENYIGYRELTLTELDEIKSANELMYEKEFSLDKLFLNFIIRDFNLEPYNDGDLVEMYFSIVKKFDEEIYGSDFNELFIEDFVIEDYSLVF